MLFESPYLKKRIGRFAQSVFCEKIRNYNGIDFSNFPKVMYVFGFNDNISEETETIYGNIHIPSEHH